MSGVATRFFTGEFEHTLDSANRLVMPAKWRMGESEELFIIPRDEGSLSVLPLGEIKRIDQAIDSESSMSAVEKQQMKESIFSEAEQVTCDKQGRMTLKAELLKHGGFDSVVILVGKGERFDIWSPKSWQQHKEELSSKRHAARIRFGI